MGIPDHLTCLLRNLYAGQEATIRTGHGTTDWFQIGKGVHQGCILSLCLFNLYSEYIMRNAGLEEAQTGIQIAGRNINNLRYAEYIMRNAGLQLGMHMLTKAGGFLSTAPSGKSSTAFLFEGSVPRLSPRLIPSDHVSLVRRSSHRPLNSSMRL